MHDFRSVSVSGAFNYARARVLWADGLLKVFGPDGPVLEIIANEPRPKPGILRGWEVETAKGTVLLRMKCMTCGGRKWWRVIGTPVHELWSAT